MNSKIFILTSFLVIGLFFNSVETNAQFQTFPTPKTSISGEKVKTVTNRRGAGNKERYIENNRKKRKIKPGRSLFARSRAVISVFFTHRKQLAARRHFPVNVKNYHKLRVS
jgi:hypothetical protein